MMLLFMLTLAAQETAAAAGKSTIVLDAGMIVLIISAIGSWLLILKNRKKEDPPATQNPAPDPKAENSPWPTIREHDGTLKEHDIKIENIVKGMDEGRRENREDHGKLFDAINSLRPGK